MNPRVTVIIPAYNAARFIWKTVRSVQAQSFADWELILVDDESTDHTFGLLSTLALGDPRIRAYSKPNGGPASARNFGYRLADFASDYVYFLDADDMMHPKCLETLVQELDENPSAGVVTSEKCNVDEHDAPLANPLRRWAPNRFGWPVVLSPFVAETPFTTYFIGTGAGLWALYRRTAYDLVRGWDEKLPVFEDCDLLAKVALVSKALHVPAILNFYRQHPGQSTKRTEAVSVGYRKFREKWDRVQGETPEQQRKLASARRFHNLVHEPGRYLRISVQAFKEAVTQRSMERLGWSLNTLGRSAQELGRGVTAELFSL